jgi:signal transduction histidine kinase
MQLTFIRYNFRFLWQHILLMLLLAQNSICTAQVNEGIVDSLRMELQKYQIRFGELNIKDTIEVDIYCELAAKYHNMGMLTNAEQCGDSAVMMAEELFQKFSKGDTERVAQRLVARSYTYRGLSYLSLSLPEKSLKDLVKAEHYARLSERYVLLGSILCYQANCYGTLLMTQEAKKCLHEARELFISRPNTALEINVYSNMAALFVSEENVDSALFYIEKAIHTARIAGDKYSEMVLLVNSLSLAKSLERYNSFQEHLDAARDLLPEYGSEPDWCMYHIYQGWWDIRQNKLDLALISLDKAYLVAKANNEDDALENIYEMKAILYASKENWDSSAYYFREFQKSIIRSVDIDRIAAISTAEANFKAENEELIAQEEIQRQRNMKWTAGISLIFITVVALLMYRLWRKSKEASLKLREQNRILENINTELRNMQYQLVNTEKQREADRVRVNIARDIHDEIGSGLTKIGMLTEVVKKNIDLNSKESERNLLKIAEYSRKVNASLSEIVWAVNPTHDSTESLIQYSKHFAIEFLRDSEMQVQLNFNTYEPEIHVKPELKRGVFMVLKESLNNVVKYSGAKNVVVHFIIKEDKFQLKVSDDGVGFNTFEKMNIGNGLMNMQTRMSQLGCHFAIYSEQGKGCSVEAWGNIIG